LYEVSAQRGVKTGSPRERKIPGQQRETADLVVLTSQYSPKTPSGIYLVEISL
jgi:hypothetical protein